MVGLSRHFQPKLASQDPPADAPAGDADGRSDGTGRRLDRQTSPSSARRRFLTRTLSGRLPCGGGSASVLVPSAAAEAAVGPDKEEAQVNGFDTQEEPQALRLEAADVADFSMPEELASYLPCEEAKATRFRNGEVERTVHAGTSFTADEVQKLSALRDLAKALKATLLPSLATAASRYLGRAKGDARRALREMLATQEWRLDYFRAGPLTRQDVEADLAHGVVYFAGRDRWMRPILTLRPARIPDAWYADKRSSSEKLTRMLVFCMEYMLQHMLVPGKVEGGVVVLDMSGMTLSKVPLGPLKSILSMLANHYVNRIFRFYVVNLPSGLRTTLQFCLRLLTERQQQKLRVLDQPADLRKEVAMHQLESDLGGSRPLARAFFPFPLVGGPFEVGSTPLPRLALQGPPTSQVVTSWAECVPQQDPDAASTRSAQSSCRPNNAAGSMSPPWEAKEAARTGISDAETASPCCVSRQASEGGASERKDMVLLEDEAIQPGQPCWRLPFACSALRA